MGGVWVGFGYSWLYCAFAFLGGAGPLPLPPCNTRGPILQGGLILQELVGARHKLRVDAATLKPWLWTNPGGADHAFLRQGTLSRNL